MPKVGKSDKKQEVQRIFETLSRAINQHMLPPGTHLVEAQLVESLNANRNHVQAALQQLALQQIITIEPNRGARVSKPSAREARELFVARRAIERGIVREITPDKIRHFSQSISEHMNAERSSTESGDRRAIVRELSNFHRLLGIISGNQVLSDILNNLMVRSSLIVSLYQRNDLPSCQHDEHGDIIAALEAGDRDRAADLMLEHLNHLESELDLDDEEVPHVNLAAILTNL